MLTDDRDPLDMLAEDFAERLRRGEHPSVGEYAAAHPDHADELKELLPAVAQMEMLKRFRAPGAAAAPPALPDRLGDFRIVRELGRGGMGVVFEAVQESLGRPVALKVLARHAQLDPKRRERFVREAQAAAKLHHTNIVPVFGVGEQDGLPYYVMQLIPGCGLNAVVNGWRKQIGATGAAIELTLGHDPDTAPTDRGASEVPTAIDADAPDYGDWRFVADVGIQAAYALHYAHKQGVLHRDVKPANLILDGETVWVTDFGLAKLMNADGLTATGDILGTLQYLPPECLNGDADARSDVYGLGATLYELLTLEPPYQADSPARLIKQVGDTDPSSPRSINPDIPRDLETIVLKAMARDPHARYASARQLAEDLEAFLGDRPIRARRTSAAFHAWRWCRRNPSVAALAASTLLAVSLAAVAGWVGFAQTNKALGREAARRQEAYDEKEKAQLEKVAADRARADAQQKSAQLKANLDLSLRSFALVFEAASGTGRPGFGVPLYAQLGGHGGPGGPGGPFGGKDGGAPRGPGGPGGPKGGPKDGQNPPGGPETESASDMAAVLETVLGFYDQFAQQKSPDAKIQLEAARASRRVCEAQASLKRPENAVLAFNRAKGLLEPLLKDSPGDRDVRGELVMAYAVAPPAAFRDRDEPLRQVAKLAGEDAWLAGAGQLRVGWAREQSGDRRGAEGAYQRAVESLSGAWRDAPEAAPPLGNLELASARYRLALLLKERGDLPTAQRVLEESGNEMRPLAEREDGPPRAERGPPHPMRGWSIMTYMTLADVCRARGDEGGAGRAMQNAGRYGFGPGGKKDGPWGGKKDKDFGPPPKE